MFNPWALCEQIAIEPAKPHWLESCETFKFICEMVEFWMHTVMIASYGSEKTQLIRIYFQARSLE